ncbi:MAG TPA: hypothetical protein VN442_23305 [Bryobacteraceae bacterium]|nr:hypothetical protein [Bryobacteraceae bacterium]
MASTTRRRAPEKTGYYLEVIRCTPMGEERRTAVLWNDGRPTAPKLARWVEDYRKVLRERGTNDMLGHSAEDPAVVNARRRARGRIVVSWSAR